MQLFASRERQAQRTALTRATLLVALTVAQGLPIVGVAAVMESSSYRIQSDSINFGGAPASASSYRLRDTLGEVATGNSQSPSYRLHAGFQQMQEIYLAMTAPADVVMAPALGSVSGGTSNGTTSVVVTTDNPAGYLLTIAAERSPALVRVGGGGSIADYSPTTGAADPTITLQPKEAVFAYTIDGSDTAATFRYNGTSCGSGADAVATCWTGLATSSQTIAERPTANHPSGTQTTIHFRVQIAADAMTPAGVYHATTTLTLLPR